MEEVLGLSDRIAVMHEGQVSGVLSRADASEESVMQLAVGQAVHTNNRGTIIEERSND